MAENFDNIESLAPVIIISGDDYFIAAEIQNKIVSLLPYAYGDIDLVISGEDQSLKDVLFECNNLPFMSLKRIILLSNRSDNLLKDDKYELDNYLKNPSDSAVLLIMDSYKVFKDYYKKVYFLQANRLTASSVISRAIEIAASYSVTMDRAAANLLTEYTDRSMSRVSIEIKKLVSYVMDKGIITTDDIVECVFPESEYQIYQFIGAAILGNGKRALEILDTLKQAGTPSIVLLSSLINQYRKLLHISLVGDKFSDKELSTLLNSPEFTISKDKDIAKKYSQMSLKKILDKLYDMEFSFKNGRITEEQALETAIAIVLNNGGK